MYILNVVMTGLLLALFHTPSWALGLGNIEVESHLGEPLIASILLTDANSKAEAQCFKLRRQVDGYPSEAIAANIQLKSLTDSSAKLLIKSYQVFGDPILELSVSSSCEDQFERTYTVLLDPPLYRSGNSASEDNAIVGGTQSKGDGADSQANASAEQPVVNTKKLKKRKKPRPANALSSTNVSPPQTNNIKRHAQEPANSSATNLEPTRELQKQSNNDAPRLLVSGGAGTGADTQLALRLETTMSDTPPAETLGQTLELNNLSDDVTAMANKLAHLESQLLALQQRNQVLEAENKNKPSLQAPISAPHETDDGNQGASNRLWYGFLALLVVSVLTAAEWYRRRRQYIHLEVNADEELPWEPQDATFEDSDALKLDATPVTKMKASPTSAKSNKENSYKPPPADDITEVNEGILEQAEVFVAHGRSSLAITLLQDHLREHPKASPAPWLLLLSLLKREGNEQDYDLAAKECRGYFNFYVPDFSEPSLDDSSTIEDYPNAKELLVNSWGSPDVIPVLDDLIYNRRNEARQGFERSAYIDILLLRSIAQSQGLSDLSRISGLSSVTKETPPAKVPTPIAEIEITAKPDTLAAETTLSAELPEVTPTEVNFSEVSSADELPVLDTDFNIEASAEAAQTEDNQGLDFNLDWPEEQAHSAEPTATESSDSGAKSKKKPKPDDKSAPLDFDIEFKI